MGANTIYAVAYANSVWVAVGTGGGTSNTGGITYSTDGTTWTRKSQSIATQESYNAVVWNGTNWIIGTGYGTNNGLYATAPSSTWTAVGIAGNVNLNIRGLWWDGTRHIIASDTGSGYPFYYSTNITASTNDGQYSSAPQLIGGPGSAKLYSSTMHIISHYYQSFVPASSSSVNVSYPQISPSAVQKYVGGGVFSLVDNTGAIFVSASGIILADSVGRIWTSF
jgi:hypothetical protein